MVFIDQVSLTHFKSFGGSVTIPLEPGFTVVTGPNGSGKSNILDGILFCLGLASSRGMRARRWTIVPASTAGEMSFVD